MIIGSKKNEIESIKIAVNTKKSPQYLKEMLDKYPDLHFMATEGHFEADIRYENGLNPIFIGDIIPELKKLGAVKEAIAQFMLKKMRDRNK